jgi:hypothetical protein
VHLRVRAHTAPWWLTAAYVVALVPADYVMAMGMLRGIRDRAEGSKARASAAEQQSVEAAHEPHLLH